MINFENYQGEETVKYDICKTETPNINEHMKMDVIRDDQIKPILEDCMRCISAGGDESVILSEEYDGNKKLSGYNFGTRKGTRSILTEQTMEGMTNLSNVLLTEMDKRTKPKIDDDDVGGKYFKADYYPAVYDLQYLQFQLDPNRSWTYLEDFKEIPGYLETWSNQHKILALVLDATCQHKNNCAYKCVFYPHINRPGPICFPESFPSLLERQRHGLSPNAAGDLISLLYSSIEHLIGEVDLPLLDGKKVEDIYHDYKDENMLQASFDFERVKWARPLCICCLFMQQANIQLQAHNNNWTIAGDGKCETTPLQNITLLGFESYIDDVKKTTNCFSNVVNINGCKMSSFLKFPFNEYNIKLIKDLDKYEVVSKSDH